jgi:hypothetical protein
MPELPEIVASLEEKRQEHLQSAEKNRQSAEKIGAAIDVLKEPESVLITIIGSNEPDPMSVNAEKLRLLGAKITEIADRKKQRQPRADRPKREPKPYVPMLPESRSHITHVLIRFGRFAYADQIARELLNDGRDMPTDILSIMLSEGLLKKIRFNNSSFMTCYGLPEWLDCPTGEWKVKNEDFLPIGKHITPKTLQVID